MPSGHRQGERRARGDLSDAVIDFFLGPRRKPFLAEKALWRPTNTTTPSPPVSDMQNSSHRTGRISPEPRLWVDRWAKK